MWCEGYIRVARDVCIFVSEHSEYLLGACARPLPSSSRPCFPPLNTFGDRAPSQTLAHTLPAHELYNRDTQQRAAAAAPSLNACRRLTSPDTTEATCASDPDSMLCGTLCACAIASAHRIAGKGLMPFISPLTIVPMVGARLRLLKPRSVRAGLSCCAN